MQSNQQTLPLSLTYQQYKRRGKNLQGFRFGEYTTLKQVGNGSFGKVYKIVNQNGDIFALKLLDKKELRQEKNRRIKEIRERLIQSEPKLMQQCDSPNLLKCLQIFENQDFKLLIIEFCEGPTLAEELKRFKIKNLNRPFPQKEAVEILRHIINGIAELHKHKIVHRDLKTDNVMKHQGIYKIIDFGFSKKLQLIDQSQKTKNTILGTPTTMAPEVMFHKQYGLKADIWSIGIIFFEIVLGIPPYDSSNAKAFYQHIQKRFNEKQPTLLRGITLSPNAHDFFKKVLRVNPDNRIGWKEMIQHPLIKIKKEQPLTDPFQERLPMQNPVVAKELEEGSLISRQIQIQVEEIKEKKQPQLPQQLEVKVIKDMQKEKKRQRVSEKVQMKQENIDLDRLIEQDKQERRKKKRRIGNNFIQLKQIRRQNSLENSTTTQRQQISQSSNAAKKQSSFNQCRLIHLECLKSELILREIIEPLQSRGLIKESRYQIEFMHLLISRCFKNLSPLYDKMKSNPQRVHRSFHSLQKQTQNLYKKAFQKFKQYNKKLFQFENKRLQKFKDFFFNIFWGQSQKQKNKIIGGVELRQDRQSTFGDFTKAEQIQYTCLYIEKIMPCIQNCGKFSDNVKKYLKKYNQIMNITLQILKQQSFHQFVQTLLRL